jgi:hypothetical protein
MASLADHLRSTFGADTFYATLTCYVGFLVSATWADAVTSRTRTRLVASTLTTAVLPATLTALAACPLKILALHIFNS